MRLSFVMTEVQMAHWMSCKDISDEDSWLMKYCFKREDKKEIVKERYFKICNCAFPYFSRFIFVQYYKFKEVFRYFRMKFHKLRIL